MRLEVVERRARRVLERLVDASAKERLVISVAALVASLLVGGVLVLVSGVLADCPETFCYNPLPVYWYLFVGPFLSTFNLGLFLKEFTLLVFTGLAVAVSFRAGLFNIGVQGQLVLGGLAAAITVVWVGDVVPGGVVGTLLLVPLGLILGGVAGGVYAAIPGALKAYAEANEVITTIMLNFVASLTAFYLVSTHVGDPTSQSVETRSIPPEARLEPVLPMFGDASFSLLVLLFAFVLVAAVTYLLWGTSFGYDLRTSGLQPDAADYAGVNPRTMVVSAMTLSGALGGLGGAVWVMMVLGRWRTGVPPLGFDGITVSVLAGNNPLGVVPAAFLFGLLKAGSLSIEFQLGVPKQLVGVLRGLVILFVAMPEFFRMIGKRMGIGGAERGRRGAAAATDGGRERAAEEAPGVTPEEAPGITPEEAPGGTSDE